MSVFAWQAVDASGRRKRGEIDSESERTARNQNESSWLGKQLRADVASVTTSALKDLRPIVISSDIRGDTHVDELTLLLREAGRSGLTLVHYNLDEDKGELLRESRMAWARDYVKSDVMVFAKVSFFDVEVMDSNHQWQQQLVAKSEGKSTQIWPKAL